MSVTEKAARMIIDLGKFLGEDMRTWPLTSGEIEILAAMDDARGDEARFVTLLDRLENGGRPRLVTC